MGNWITLLGLLSLLAPTILTIGIIVEFIKIITNKIKKNVKRRNRHLILFRGLTNS